MILDFSSPHVTLLQDTIGPSVGILTGLAACFGVAKVAKKARVDSGPKRESRVLLLVPPLGRE